MKASQRHALRLMLIDSLGITPPRDVVVGFVGADIALTMPFLPSPRDLAEWIIDRALEQQTPQRLIHIIRVTDVGDGRAASLIDLADRLDAEPSSWRTLATAAIVDWSVNSDPLEVIDGRPFVDRGSFRNLIPRLDNPQTPSCAVVKGDSGQGKTYLHDFCRGLASHWGRRQPGVLRVGFTEASASTVTGLSPENLAMDLASGLGTQFGHMPRPHEDHHRYARNLAAWLLHFTPTGALPAVAILDGFDLVGVPEPVHTFIEELVRGASEDDSRLRVVLLGYDLGRLEDEGLDFFSCVLEHVGDTEIENWFRRRFPNQPEFLYDDAVKMITKRLATSSSQLRMRTLCGLMQAASAVFPQDGAR